MTNDGDYQHGLGVTERELRIGIWLDDSVAFEGTAAQLTAEGLIHKDLVWPCAAENASWTANGLRYRLSRKRPVRHKGPMRSWLELDNWEVRITVISRENRWHMHRVFERKTEELRAEYRRTHTVAGRLEWATQLDRYRRAQMDKKFQAFKALVPGMNPPKRGRSRKTPANLGS